MSKKLLSLIVASLLSVSSVAFAGPNLDPKSTQNKLITAEEARAQGKELITATNTATINGVVITKNYLIATTSKRVNEAIALGKEAFTLDRNPIPNGMGIDFGNTVIWVIKGNVGRDGKIELKEEFPYERILSIDYIEYNDDGSEKSKRTVTPKIGVNGEVTANIIGTINAEYAFEMYVYYPTIEELQQQAGL